MLDEADEANTAEDIEAETDEIALARLAETSDIEIEAETLAIAADSEAGSIGVVAVAIIEEILAS